MNLNEIKTAVDSGQRVKWANPAYDVIRDSCGQYLIVCNLNQSTIGLTWRDGVTLNGRPEQFYIAK